MNVQEVGVDAFAENTAVEVAFIEQSSCFILLFVLVLSEKEVRELFIHNLFRNIIYFYTLTI